KMIRVFIDKSTEELKLLKKAAKEEDMKIVGLVAHKMKPAAAYMGISAVESKINEMNRLAKEGNNTKEIIVMVDEIEKSLKEVFSELEKEINKYK
ncbi:MAG: Hpt domain-containing protein, partial [Bacteroidota bacterium]